MTDDPIERKPAREPYEWRPIETAPLGRTVILVCRVGDARAHTAYWAPIFKKWLACYWGRPPDLWMPFPVPPEAAS
jgi:hypothetical protein